VWRLFFFLYLLYTSYFLLFKILHCNILNRHKQPQKLLVPFVHMPGFGRLKIDLGSTIEEKFIR
jgi:hypothetical protein